MSLIINQDCVVFNDIILDHANVANLIRRNLITDAGEYYKPIERAAREPFSQLFTINEIKGKDVLTTGVSGDYFLSIAKYKPNSISVFSQNILDKYFQELKIAGVLTLNYNEYLQFFYGNRPFNNYTLTKILKILSKESCDFWIALFKNNNPEIVLKSKLFDQRPVNIKNALAFNPYLVCESEYLNTKDALMNIYYSFYNLSSVGLNEIKKSFDTIYLGNIIGFNGLDKSTSRYLILNLFGEIAKKNLKENGIIIASSYTDVNLDEQFKVKKQNSLNIIKYQKK